MKVTKAQLRKLIQEAMPSGGVPDVMGAIGGGRRQVGPTVPDDMINRIKSIGRGDLQDHLYDIVDAIESGADDYTLDMLKKNIEDAERLDEGFVSLRRKIRNMLKEAMDVVNVQTGEIIDFGEDSISGIPDAALPDLVKRLDLDMSPNGTLSNADFEKLENETLGKQDRRAAKRKSAQMAADRERLDIDNLLQRLRDWASDASQDYMADNPEADLQDIAFDLADAWEFAFEMDEQEEILWHFDGDINDVKIYAAESMG
mgnify:CR=1 FL=1